MHMAHRLEIVQGSCPLIIVHVRLNLISLTLFWAQLFARLCRQQSLTQVCLAVTLRIICGHGDIAIADVSVALVQQHATQSLFPQQRFNFKD